MTAGPIPWQHVMEYADRHGLDEGMLSAFTIVMRELDDAYLTWIKDDQAGRARADRRENKRDRKKAKK